MTYFAIDRTGALSNMRRTAVGGYLVDARLARTGRMEYPNGEGGATTHVNTAEVLQSALDDLTTVPVTNRHPPEFVTAETYQKYAAGHIVGTPTFDGEYIVATLAIQDARLIRDIETGVSRELSMGYQFDGVVDGDVLTRTSIKFNHAAVLPAGRAGAKVCLVLDSKEIPNEEVEMSLKIKGVQVAADAAQSAVDSLEGELAATKAELEKAIAEKSAAEFALAAATSQEATDAAVAAELERRAQAKAKADRLARVKDGFPGECFDGKSDDYIEAFDVMLAKRNVNDPEGLGRIIEAAPVVVVDAKPAKIDFRQEMIERNRKLANGVAC